MASKKSTDRVEYFAKRGIHSHMKQIPCSPMISIVNMSTKELLNQIKKFTEENQFNHIWKNEKTRLQLNVAYVSSIDHGFFITWFNPQNGTRSLPYPSDWTILYIENDTLCLDGLDHLR